MDIENASAAETIRELLQKRRFSELRNTVSEMNPADIAVLMEELEEEEDSMILLFRILPKELAAEVFVDVDGEVQEQLVRAFTDRELREVMNELYVDDAVDMIEEMPANVVKRILRHTDPEMRKSINEILQYPSDSAGSLMTTEYIDLKAQMTVEQSFAYIRRTGVDKETVYTCYVIDENRHLIGLVTVKDLLLSSYESRICDIMETNVISVDTLEDREVVAEVFQKYDFLALPVVDKERRLVGIITFDDAMDVMEEETTEDIEKMAAITPTGKSYIRTGVTEIFLKRVPWLMILMISATFTGMIISSFEDKLKASVVLTAFIPMLMGTGGNSGSQASVSVIRGLSLGEIEFSDIGRVLWKEARVALMCGVALGVVNFGKMMLVDCYLLGNAAVTPAVCLVVSITLLLSVLFAKIVGGALPILAKAIGFDPAVMASPFITTIVDALSLQVYFVVATQVLQL